MTASWSFY